MVEKLDVENGDSERAVWPLLGTEAFGRKLGRSVNDVNPTSTLQIKYT